MLPSVHVLPILRDNYCYIVQGGKSECIIIDPGQPSPVISFLHEHALTPVAIFNTHHHGDHVAGNAELVRLWNIPVIAPAKEMHKIPMASRPAKEGDVLEFADLSLQVIETPGHTAGHICFYETQGKSLFCGDTLFSMGCGRLLEGTAEEMFQSLEKIKSLSPETMIYCGHEYTEENGNFALGLGPENQALRSRMAEVRILRMNAMPTIPVGLFTELETNPFLKATDAKSFAEIRKRKDKF
jgi:hydroxyacylglutathione hydrolase